MSDFLALVLYLIAIFLLAIGNAVVIYHIVRYRDPGDASSPVLLGYLVLVIIILVATLFGIDWSSIVGF